ncbi:MAG: phosphate transport regulator [Dehalococcoidia bacterium SG8_51_3]|nr:MAG: phosphate transport regulator [Dehalococcoidia bacterium SG8_51_3]
MPRGKIFFELYEESAENMVKTAEALKDMVDNWENIEQRVEQIDEFEHIGDNTTHKIIELLHRTFVTPFDQEDMALLAHSLDDIVDLIHAAAVAMHIYKIDTPKEGAKELAGIIVTAAKEVEVALKQLRNQPKLKQVLEHCIEINRLENAADKVFRSAMAELFDNCNDTADIIKWREILEHLESATDRCEDVANVLEGVALKHA